MTRALVRAAMTPKRRWLGIVGPILMAGAFLAIAFGGDALGGAGVNVLLVVGLAGGVLFGFGLDQPGWGWWGVVVISLSLPTSVVLTLLLDALSSGNPVPPTLLGDLAGMWVPLAVVCCPSTLVGIGIHRGALRLAARQQADRRGRCGFPLRLGGAHRS